MTDIVQRLRSLSPVDRAEAADEIERLRAEVRTLRNFMGAIRNNLDLALGDYGQPTGKKTYG